MSVQHWACSWIALLLLSGCGPTDPDGAVPAEATDCAVDSGAEPSDVRMVEVGDAAQDFLPYAEGSAVPLVEGYQGLWMITPWVRVAATPEDGDEGCFVVRLEHEFLGDLASDPNAQGGTQLNVHFVREGSFLISDGALYHPFTLDAQTLSGQDIHFRVEVTAKTFVGESDVNITLQ